MWLCVKFIKSEIDARLGLILCFKYIIEKNEAIDEKINVERVARPRFDGVLLFHFLAGLKS